LEITGNGSYEERKEEIVGYATMEKAINIQRSRIFD